MTLEFDCDGNMLLRQPAGWLRYAIGVPLRALRALFALGAVSSFIHRINGQVAKVSELCR